MPGCSFSPQIPNRVNFCRIFLPVLLVCAFAAPVTVSAEPVREIRVGIAATQDIRSDTTWKEKFKERLAYASQIFEREFNIRFVPITVWEWQLAGDDEDTSHLIENLMTSFPLDKAQVDVMIGITRLKSYKNLTSLRDLDVIGRARPFSGYLVLRYPSQPLLKVQEETVLSHELGHLFGAIHTKDPRSMMYPISDRQTPTTFDEINREIIRLAREVDFKKGAEFIEQGSAGQLLSAYMKLVETDQSFDFYYWLGVFEIKLGKTDEAVKAWKAAINLNPQYAQARFDLGVLYAKLGKYDEAIQELGTAVDLFVLNNQNKDKASALNWLGISYFNKQNYESAYYAWNRALVLDPKNYDAKINMAAVQMKRARYDDAINLLTEALRAQKRNPKILSNLGWAHFYLGNYQKAVDYLKMALQVAPQQTIRGEINEMNADQPSEIFIRLGNVYLKTGRRQEAVAGFENACKINPTIECHKRLGESYYQLGLWDQCVQEYAGLLKVKKDDPDVYGILGVCLTQQEKFPIADGVFREGLKYAKTPKQEALLHKNIGILYNQARHFEAAQLELQQSLQENWNDVEAQLNLAVAFLAQGLYIDAKNTLETVMSMDPNNQKARDMYYKLKDSFTDKPQ